VQLAVEQQKLSSVVVNCNHQSANEEKLFSVELFCFEGGGGGGRFEAQWVSKLCNQEKFI
jgi:hypothetical protein